MKRRQLASILLVALISIVGIGCSQNQYVVLSQSVVMNIKDGKSYPVKLDSTYKVYDKIKIVGSGEDRIITKISN